MNANAMERLTKGLFTQKKRKEKASGESSKWVEVGASDSTAPTATEVAPEVCLGDEAVPTTHAKATRGGSLPPENANIPFEDRLPDPSVDQDKERTKWKVAIMKKAHKVHPDEPSRSGSEDQGSDPFSNPDIIWDLIDKFTLLEEVDHLAGLDREQLI
ncbi:hypothetical protein COCNU_scaffold001080G000010 [Cocos nucifera]|nr:hypothetical protein [Cocos nucifera]